MAAIITATGTWTVPDKKGRYVGGSGSEFVKMGDDDFSARASIPTGKNLFDEVGQFVGLVAAALGVPGLVAIDQISMVLADMRRCPEMGERVYQQ
jgi:hypothetical protein